MKNTPILIAIPALAVILVLGAVVAWKVMAPVAPVEQVATPYTAPVVQDQTGKPASSFGAAPSAGASGQVVTNPTTSDLQTTLDTTVDDGGQSEFDALAHFAASL
jgi:hypothetical protein